MQSYCTYCGLEVDPNSQLTYTRVRGWEKKPGIRASGVRGGSDIVLREHVAEYACYECITKMREGLSIGQDSLL